MTTMTTLTTAVSALALTTALAAGAAPGAPVAQALDRSAQPASVSAKGPSRATAVLRSTSGNAVGTVTFRDVPGGTRVSIEARYIKPGWHGFHIHSIGKCERRSADPKDPTKVGAFLSAGGHLAKGDEKHPNHVGDLPVILAGKNTKVSMTTVTDRFKVADLFDKDGSAVMIHAGSDNYANIPARQGGPDAETLKAGDGGARSTCGVVRR